MAVKEALEPDSDIPYTEHLLHHGCVRIGQINGTAYIETKYVPTSKAEESLLDILYGKRNVQRVLIDAGTNDRYGKSLKRKIDHSLPDCSVELTPIENTFEWWKDDDATCQRVAV